MEASVIVQILFTQLFFLTILTESQISGKFETQFENPLENFPLLNIEFDYQTGNVFVSGKNVLYMFSMDGTKLIQKKAGKTGPDENCLPQLPPEKLKEEYCGADHNTVMVVTHDSLITCGTLKGGLCMRRDKESLNITSTSLNIRLVSNEKASALGIFLNITDTNYPGMFQNIVLFAKEYTALPLSPGNLEEAAIFSVLPDLSAINLENSKYGRIFDLILKYKVNVKMDYRVVFENEKFVFLLVNQNSQSKLVKVCKSIDSEDPKKVYEDIPISCNARGTNLTHVKHGIFITISGKRYLVGLFSSSKPILSAMCVFEENEIYQAFLKSREHRYMCPKNDLSEEDMIFANDVKPKVCITKNEAVNDFYDAFHKGDYCNDVTNHIPWFGIIVGLLPLQGNVVYSTKSHRFTVVGSSSVNNLTSLYIGTDKGYVIQLLYDTEKNETSVLADLKLDSSEIRAIRSINEKTFIMSQHKIVKLTPKNNCAQYSGSCQQCMDVYDFDCGWCATKGSCSTFSDCSSTYWLSSMKNECLSLDLSIYLGRHVYKLEGRVLTILTPLIFVENMTCNLDGFGFPKSFNTENINCRIRSTVIFAEETFSTSVPVGVFVSIVVLIFVLFLCASFLFYKWGVRQGHKLNQKNLQENIADHYQSQNEDSYEETHTYEQPRPATADTPMGHEQELTTYVEVL